MKASRFLVYLILVSCGFSAQASSSLESIIQLFEQGEPAKAKPLFETHLKSNPKDANAMAYLSRIVAADDLDDAEDIIEDALDIAPQNAFVQFTYGNIMGSQAQNSVFSALSYAGKSLNGFEKAVEFAPDNIEYRMGLMQFYVFAPGIAGGDKDLGWKQVEAINALNPMQGLKASVNFYLAQEDEKAASDAIEQGIKNYSDKADFYYLRGLMNVRSENYQMAFQDFKAGAKTQANSKQEHVERLKNLYQMAKASVLLKSELQQGLDAIEEFAQHKVYDNSLPSKDWAKFRKGNLLELRGQTKEAKNIYISLMNVDDDQLKKQVRKKV